MYNMLWGAQDGIRKRPKEQTLEEEDHVCRKTESKAASWCSEGLISGGFFQNHGLVGVDQAVFPKVCFLVHRLT